MMAAEGAGLAAVSQLVGNRPRRREILVRGVWHGGYLGSLSSVSLVAVVVRESTTIGLVMLSIAASGSFCQATVTSFNWQGWL